MSRSRKRNPYRGSRRFDKTCRCNGKCPYCRANRLRAGVVQAEKSEPRNGSTVENLLVKILATISPDELPLRDGIILRYRNEEWHGRAVADDQPEYSDGPLSKLRMINGA